MSLHIYEFDNGNIQRLVPPPPPPPPPPNPPFPEKVLFVSHGKFKLSWRDAQNRRSATVKAKWSGITVCGTQYEYGWFAVSNDPGRLEFTLQHYNTSASEWIDFQGLQGSSIGRHVNDIEGRIIVQPPNSNFRRLLQIQRFRIDSVSLLIGLGVGLVAGAILVRLI